MADAFTPTTKEKFAAPIIVAQLCGRLADMLTIAGDAFLKPVQSATGAHHYARLG